jgi:hypothetical protein
MCLRVLSEPLFLKDTNTALGAKIYKTCYICRTRANQSNTRRQIQKRALQERVSTPPLPGLLQPQTLRPPRTPQRSPQVQAANSNPLPQYGPERPVALQPGFLLSSQ